MALMPWRAGCLWILALELTLVLTYVSVTAQRVHAQSRQHLQEVFNAEFRLRTESLEHRMSKLESDEISGRMRVLESDMGEVKLLTRGAAVAIIGQLVIAALGARKRSATDLKDEAS